MGLTCTLWDHVLTFPDEVTFIWMRKRWDLTRMCFLWNRYIAEIGLLLTAYGQFYPSNPTLLYPHMACSNLRIATQSQQQREYSIHHVRFVHLIRLGSFRRKPRLTHKYLQLMFVMTSCKTTLVAIFTLATISIAITNGEPF